MELKIDKKHHRIAYVNNRKCNEQPRRKEKEQQKQ